MEYQKPNRSPEALALKKQRAATRVRDGQIYEGKDIGGTLIYEYHTRPGGEAVEVTRTEGYDRLLGGELDLYIEYNPDGTVKEMFELRNPPSGWKADKLGREPRRKRKIAI
ncbi:hypothetical protein KKG52_03895 [Patescibacteria group bacterium]|nr:hypothetical protein [Patescibacteria group bacterium]